MYTYCIYMDSSLLIFLSYVIDECQNKYGNANAWKYCCRVFDLLTVAAVSISIKDISRTMTYMQCLNTMFYFS
jgi:hypothetical protein